MENKFKTLENLEEEMGRWREEIEKKKKEAETLNKELPPANKEEIISEALKEHIEKYLPETLGEKYKITEEEEKTHIEKLEPEEHDRQISMLLEIVKEKGVINTFKIAKELSAHLQDDFHKALIHYLNYD